VITRTSWLRAKLGHIGNIGDLPYLELLDIILYRNFACRPASVPILARFPKIPNLDTLLWAQDIRQCNVEV